MPLKGLDYLVVALGGAAIGLCLLSDKISRFFGSTSHPSDYSFIAFMALSVVCLWCSAKFLILNRRRKDALYFLIVLAPIILASLYVTCSYVTYLMETYHTIHAFNTRYLVP